MTSPTVCDYLKYANLQMAAEAFLKQRIDWRGALLGWYDLITALKAGNNRSLLFTDTQATAFADPNGRCSTKRPTRTPAFPARCSKRSRTTPRSASRRTNSSSPSAPPNSSTISPVTTRPPTNWNWPKAAFALGQIADMEAWYAELLAPSRTGGQPPLLGKTYSVTGYSLGGHLATVFNQLRQAEDTTRPAAGESRRQVITFNGAGVGQIDNGSLSGYDQSLHRTCAVRPPPRKACPGCSRPTKGKEIYAQLRAEISSPINRVLTGAMRDRVATAFGTIGEGETLLKADYDLLLGRQRRAVSRLAGQASRQRRHRPQFGQRQRIAQGSR
jgi:hypothetical protein